MKELCYYDNKTAKLLRDKDVNAKQFDDLHFLTNVTPKHFKKIFYEQAIVFDFKWEGT